MKKISLILALTMLLSLCTGVVSAADDTPDYSDMSKIISMYNNSVPDDISSWVDAPFMVTDGNIIPAGNQTGYNAASKDGTFTLKNIASSHKYVSYIVVVPLYPNGNGYYTNVRYDENNESHSERFFYTTDGKFIEYPENPLYADNIVKIKKGESVEFPLPEKALTQDNQELVFSEDMMWIVAASTVHGEYVDVTYDGKTVKEFKHSEYDTGWTNYWFVKVDDKTIDAKLAAANIDSRFHDVKTTDYFYAPIKWALEKEITNGTGTHTFSPNNTCTQAQILTFLWRAQGCPQAEKNLLWVDNSKYYATAFKWAAEKKIISGKIEPDAPCTRIDTVRYMYLLETDAQADISLANKMVDVAPEDKAIVAWALERGITNGTGVNTFSPNNTCTRGQIATFLYRAYAK